MEKRSDGTNARALIYFKFSNSSVALIFIIINMIISLVAL